MWCYLLIYSVLRIVRIVETTREYEEIVGNIFFSYEVYYMKNQSIKKITEHLCEMREQKR